MKCIVIVKKSVYKFVKQSTFDSLNPIKAGRTNKYLVCPYVISGTSLETYEWTDSNKSWHVRAR